MTNSSLTKTSITELWIDRNDFSNTKIVEQPQPELANGEVLVHIEKFALTSNNVTYALTGDMIGYWHFFPAVDDSPQSWGKVPVWGVATVVASNCDTIDINERLYGYFPMASHLIMEPGAITDNSFNDMAAHRQQLPPLYNNYQRLNQQPEFLKPYDNERCLLFPLFITSYSISDYLEDNQFFGAQQVVIGSVSSKTGLGLAAFLKANEAFEGSIVGLTSERNISFLDNLGYCDQLLTYGNEQQIDVNLPTVYVDMSGNDSLRVALHGLLQRNLARSISVGVTHWQASQITEQPADDANTDKTEFFFAPTQIGKREKEWGRGVFMQKAMLASTKLADSFQQHISVEFIDNPTETQGIWELMLDNKVLPTRGIMVSWEQK